MVFSAMQVEIQANDYCDCCCSSWKDNVNY